MLHRELTSLMYNLDNPATAPRVLVVGDVMLDRYCHGSGSPGASHPACPTKPVDEVPGGAANVAANAAALGAHVMLAGFIGEDDEGARLEDQLAAAGVDCRLTPIPRHLTTTKTRFVSKERVTLRLDRERPIPKAIAATLRHDLIPEIRAADIVILSDYAKGAIDDTSTWIRACRGAGRRVLVDTKQPAADCRGADLLTPNLDEVRTILDRPVEAGAIAARGQALLARTGAHNLLATLGSDGLLLIRPRQQPLPIPALGRCEDATGAGDTVIAAAAIALATGTDLPDAVRFAAHAAAVVVAKPGTAVAHLEEVTASMNMVEPSRSWGS